ncbi:Cytochrome P450 9e2 [Gryllus bimaculatus]|nr:Cytochrome P450 9e2 [Gryllus bimaculatus]
MRPTNRLYRGAFNSELKKIEEMDEIIEYYLQIFAITFTIGLLTRAYFNYKTKYFSQKGLYTYASFPIVGSLGPVFFKKYSFPVFCQMMYNDLKHFKIAGFYDATKPAYFISDPDMLRNILVKDFDHFVDRFHAIPTDAESFFGKNLLSLKGLQWHGVRTALSPAFTASKMKNMFVLMTEIADQLVEFLHHSCRNRKETVGGIFSLEMKDLWTKFAADVIGTTAYGVKINSLQNPNNEFLACGKAMTNITVLRAARFFGYACFPKLMKVKFLLILSSENLS